MKSKIFLCFCIVLLITSCKKENQTTDLEAVEAKTDTTLVFGNEHNSQNSLDWEGVYKGILPCADCDGIETEIVINSDLTFVKKIKYLGKEDIKGIEEKGSFSWNKDGSTIILQGINEESNQYKVGENTLTHLDMEGKIIIGDLAQNYILKK